MGCDIHLYAERKENGKWISVTQKEMEYPGTDYEYTRLQDLDVGRNYDLFAILADVRNGYGFAGVPTGAGFVPIATPRGVPEDASPEFREEVASWDGDGHSHSWLTIREILDYDWNRLTAKLGIVSAKEWLALMASEESPSSYCGGITGRGIKVLGYPEAVELLSQEGEEGLLSKCTHVQHMWTQTYRDRVGHFLDSFIPEMQKLGDPEDVRLVFFFDN